MSRLPSRLQPAWPLLKRAHRLLTLVTGLLLRRSSMLLGSRRVPRAATSRSMDTARREPDHVSLHPVGPGEELERGPAVGDPPRHWVFEQGRTARIPATYLLEVREGRLVGEFGATVTPGDVLDYQTSGYFGIQGWREHPIFLSPLPATVDRVDGTVLSLTTRGCATNYYHFLFDSIARYGLFEEAMPGEHVDAVVVPHGARYQRELLELAGIRGRLLQPGRGRTYAARRLLVPSTPNQDLDAPRHTVAWLRERLPSTPGYDGPKRLYLTRGEKPNTRRYVQEPQLWPWLEANGFVRLDPGTLSVQQQIDVFSGAEVVVGPHGAALTNLTFCRPGTQVLEMFAASYVHLGLWSICEAIGGVDYRYLVAAGDHRPGRSMTGVLDDVSIPVDRVKQEISAMLR